MAFRILSTLPKETNMKYIDHTARYVDDKLRTPKNLEFVVLGKLVHDLAEMVKCNYVSSDVRLALESDLKIVSQAVRSRNNATVAALSSVLRTKIILLERNFHTRGDSFAFFVSYQLEAFLKKFPFTGTDTYQPAIDKFVSGERVCGLYNSENYKAWAPLSNTMHRLYGNSIDEIRDDIQVLLGESAEGCSDMVGAAHGPGVSLGDLYKDGETTSYYKWRHLPYSVTHDALPYAKAVILSDPRWIGALDNWYRERCSFTFYDAIDVNDFWSRIFNVVSSNRITTVPKTALTDRTIAIEPLMNVFLQLGVDRYIRKRLQSEWNIDINSQEKNQDLAKLGSIDGSYATIDLSNASDTISLKICETLLPAQWYNLLLDLRSPCGELKRKVVHYEKLSSMGNGFTFAIETVIFAALARHAVRRNQTNLAVSVFGDDIIVPTAAAADTIDLINLAGFTVNPDKSFVKGPFRESCGTDWFLGTNVRPVFLKRNLHCVRDIFYTHNALRSLRDRLPWEWEADFSTTLSYLRKLIPKKYEKVVGPSSDTLDTHLFVDKLPKWCREKGFYLTLQCRPRTFNKNTDFFFRKLMVSLRGDRRPSNKWSDRRKLSTGNSFDVTKRDRTKLICAKRKLY
jgi:hypothetical protein